ncbi:hypothetical protein PP637_gp51 [Arthrobacter phage Persistence]|uniref:Uncharacterized protein n=1 Tax=Arthrobacter phage Persistence TaxID=2836007 RepID=A0A8F3E470_9CAUD|nr:hypothetical protein PP637_gp51 [Arthrobacter phage Persistence]QWY79680.1 hypothetical protein SEA_PERSISTENCE_51 [Arthrobacter phage Persistence]
MPKNRDYLSELAAYNRRHGVTATFSEMKKTARRIAKLDSELEPIDLDKFFLLHADPTGEEATDNVMAERAKRAAHNHSAAARRLSRTNNHVTQVHPHHLGETLEHLGATA